MSMKPDPVQDQYASNVALSIGHPDPENIQGAISGLHNEGILITSQLK
jgi:hypothetical protein